MDKLIKSGESSRRVSEDGSDTPVHTLTSCTARACAEREPLFRKLGVEIITSRPRSYVHWDPSSLCSTVPGLRRLTCLRSSEDVLAIGLARFAMGGLDRSSFYCRTGSCRYGLGADRLTLLIRSDEAHSQKLSCVCRCSLTRRIRPFHTCSNPRRVL